MPHPSYRLKWNKRLDRDAYIKQLLDYRQKKRVMKPQIITLVCLVCGRGPEIETRFLDRYYYCEGCRESVRLFRQRANYRLYGKKSKYSKEYKAQYQRKWNRINYEKVNKAKKEYYKKYGRKPYTGIKWNSWRGVVIRSYRRRHAKRVRWFRPIKERLTQKNDYY